MTTGLPRRRCRWLARFRSTSGDPFFAWMSFLPDIGPLGPLASGDSVLVTIDYTNTVAGETVFPGQGYPAPHFGPFHNGAGTTEYGCFITAS